MNRLKLNRYLIALRLRWLALHILKRYGHYDDFGRWAVVPPYSVAKLGKLVTINGESIDAHLLQMCGLRIRVFHYDSWVAAFIKAAEETLK